MHDYKSKYLGLQSSKRFIQNMSMECFMCRFFPSKKLYSNCNYEFFVNIVIFHFFTVSLLSRRF